jgi:hypothetical protein
MKYLRIFYVFSKNEIFENILNFLKKKKYIFLFYFLKKKEISNKYSIIFIKKMIYLKIFLKIFSNKNINLTDFEKRRNF